MMIKSQDQPVNLVLIGSGHYSTGHTVLSGHTNTDKDFGVLLPSALYLKSLGKVGQISICGREGDKFDLIRKKINHWKVDPNIDVSFISYPSPGVTDAKSYIQALDDIPRPCGALIAVPDDLHVDVMLACAQRDIPFLVVKPAVTNLKDFYLVKSSLNSNFLALVDYHKVYDESNLLILDDIINNRYGKIQHISSLMSQRRDMIEIYIRWLKDNPKININHYLGSHYIHLTSFLTKATPIDVRSTQQFGYIQNHYKINVADTIQTQIRWRSESGYIFASHHIAGWADPSETESMTFQQMHLLTENGHIFSDQRYRGTRKVLLGTGLQAPNPYFFNLTKNLMGQWNLSTKYGFQSIETFVDLLSNGIDEIDNLNLPTFYESENVTAILAAADLSLKNNSAVISIQRNVQNEYFLN
jgi:D-galacturonate reductase